MTRLPPLVDIPKLRRLIDDVSLGDKNLNEYLKARWLHYVDRWDSRARRAKGMSLSLRSAVVIGGAFIPALVGLRELETFVEVEWIFATLSILASLVVAICTGLESVFGWGDIWREKRMATEVIESEGFSFLQLTGDYRKFPTHAEGFKEFAEKVENLIRHEIKDYIIVVTPRPDTHTTGSHSA